MTECSSVYVLSDRDIQKCHISEIKEDTNASKLIYVTKEEEVIFDKCLNLNPLSLQSISKLINAKLKVYENEKMIQKILDAVDRNGYFISDESGISIPGLCQQKLPLYVQIYAYDRDEKSDEKMNNDDLSEEQPNWTDYLNYITELTGDEDYEIMGEWEGADWDEPITATGVIKVTLYYKISPKPENNSSFKYYEAETGDGEFLQGSIKNNKIVLDGSEIDDLENWDDLELFILPKECEILN